MKKTNKTMKLHLGCLLLVNLLVHGVRAQDSEQTKNGAIGIHPIVHGTIAFTWNDQTIFVDPYGGAEGFADFNDPDIIVITDIHGDHLHMETLNGLKTGNTNWVVPQAVADQMPEGFAKKITILGNGDHAEVNGIQFDALPMYNLPETADSRHPKGRGNGYVITFADKRVYISGDTEDIQEMRNLNNIDIAFVCMNLPYTMDINQAASAVLVFKPKVVYPFHYRGKGGLADVDSFKSMVNIKDDNIEVRLRNWYP